MGAPELPTDTGDSDVQSQLHNINHAPIPSDDSDNESNNAYEGYEPLSMGDNVDDPLDVNTIDVGQDDNEHIINESSVSENQQLMADPNLPHVESVDVEIERHVWSQPRPRELQIELDSSQTEQILTAMANFSLPNISVPDWARGVPEERWKDELLQRIRQRKEV